MDSINTSDIQGQDADLAEILPISDIQKQFEDELFAQAQRISNGLTNKLGNLFFHQRRHRIADGREI